MATPLCNAFLIRELRNLAQNRTNPVAGSLAQDREITGECYRVLFILLAELDFENFIYIPQTEIAQKLSMHPQSVHRAIKLLVQKGILLRNERGYRLNPHYGWKGKSKKLQNARLELVKG
jgi:DNA-binding MarR family transcriptional regulator